MTNEDGDTSLDVAVLADDREIVEYLTLLPKVDKGVALLHAVNGGNIDILLSLLDSKSRLGLCTASTYHVNYETS